MRFSNPAVKPTNIENWENMPPPGLQRVQ